VILLLQAVVRMCDLAPPPPQQAQQAANGGSSPASAASSDLIERLVSELGILLGDDDAEPPASSSRPLDPIVSPEVSDRFLFCRTTGSSVRLRLYCSFWCCFWVTMRQMDPLFSPEV